MTSHGTWDMYGTYHYAFDEFTEINEAEVARIIQNRKKKLQDKQLKQLKKLETKMQAQIEQRFKERKLLDHEVDTTSIDAMFEIYNTVGGLGQEAM